MEQFEAEGVYFLGEQSGEVERKFIERIVGLVKLSSMAPSSAYLCRVHYGDPNKMSVALCMASLNGEPQLFLEEISIVFHQMFGTKEHLDIILLRGSQEQRMAARPDADAAVRRSAAP